MELKSQSEEVKIAGKWGAELGWDLPGYVDCALDRLSYPVILPEETGMHLIPTHRPTPPGVEKARSAV
jgi:hypothetical protein